MGRSEPTTRRYRSPRRELQARQTRAEVLAAGRRLFAEQGWAATGMRDIAAAAGVSVETLYTTFGSKGALFAVVLDNAVVGDDDPVPLGERSEFAALGTGRTLADRAALAGALITGIHQRASALEGALREGAPSDAALAQLLRKSEENRRVNDEQGLVLVLRRPVDAAERDAFWAQTSPEVYDALTAHSGWSDDQYAAWVVSLVIQLSKKRSRKVGRPQ